MYTNLFLANVILFSDNTDYQTFCACIKLFLNINTVNVLLKMYKSVYFFTRISGESI